MNKIDMSKQYRTIGASGTLSQQVRILCVDAPGMWPVVGFIGECSSDVHRWDPFGRYKIYRRDGEICKNDLVEVDRWQDFCIDEPVMATMTPGGKEKRRYFAGVSEKGLPLVWSGGGTSWSCDRMVEFESVRRPEPWEYGKVC